MTTLKDKQKLKKQLLQMSINQLSETISNLKREMDEHQQMANDYGPPKDRYDAFRSQMLRRRDIFAEQLQKANMEMTTLLRINPDEIKTQAEPGSVIITDKQNIFIAVSIGKVKVENAAYYVVSPSVPVFQALKGLKAGESAKVNNTEMFIQDVF